jgi:hypothetical protein
MECVQSWVDADLARTNNAVERFNRRLKASVSCVHPIIWRFLGVLKREQSVSDVQLDQVLGGQEPPPKKKKYMDCNARLVSVTRDFAKRELMAFLRSIAHNVSK